LIQKEDNNWAPAFIAADTTDLPQRLADLVDYARRHDLEVYGVRLALRPAGPNPVIGFRKLLKFALRTLGLRCVSLVNPAKPQTRPNRKA
jgi:hypothetical protein